MRVGLCIQGNLRQNNALLTCLLTCLKRTYVPEPHLLHSRYHPAVSNLAASLSLGISEAARLWHPTRIVLFGTVGA